MKEDYNDIRSLSGGLWSWVAGGNISSGCEQDSFGLFFKGTGLKIVESIELDLSNAR